MPLSPAGWPPEVTAHGLQKQESAVSHQEPANEDSVVLCNAFFGGVGKCTALMKE